MGRLVHFLADLLGKADHVSGWKLDVLVEVHGGHEQHALAHAKDVLALGGNGRECCDRHLLCGARLRSLIEENVHGQAPFANVVLCIVLLFP